MSNSKLSTSQAEVTIGVENSNMNVVLKPKKLVKEPKQKVVKEPKQKTKKEQIMPKVEDIMLFMNRGVDKSKNKAKLIRTIWPCLVYTLFTF